MTTSEVFEVAAAIVGSVGGATLLILGLSNWLGKVWATRLMDRERADLAKSVEYFKTELSRSLEREKLIAQEQERIRFDALVRKREIYAALATSARIFSKPGPTRTEKEKEAFLKAYDEGFLWISEDVASAMRDLLVLMESGSLAVPDLADKRKEAYQRCMRAMRRDSGFPESHAEYRLISF